MKKLLVIAMAIGTFASCKKDDAVAQLDVTAANIAGVWKITADSEVEGGVTYDRFNGGTISGVAYPSDYDACEKDDTFTFSTTTVTNAEGATSCTPPTAPYTFPYVVQTSTKAITVSGLFSGTIKNLTANTMVIESTSTSSPGVTVVQTITFSK